LTDHFVVSSRARKKLRLLAAAPHASAGFT